MYIVHAVSEATLLVRQNTKMTKRMNFEMRLNAKRTFSDNEITSENVSVLLRNVSYDDNKWATGAKELNAQTVFYVFLRLSAVRSFLPFELIKKVEHFHFIAYFSFSFSFWFFPFNFLFGFRFDAHRPTIFWNNRARQAHIEFRLVTM